MKKILTTITLSLLCIFMAPSCISQGKIFKDVSNLPGVTTVYIGPAMMKLAGTGMAMSDDKDYAKYVKDIKSIDVMTCEEASSVPQVRALCDSIVEARQFELLLESNDDGEHTSMYGRVPENEGDFIEDLLIYNVSAKECNFVYIRGKVDVGAIMSEKD